MSLLIILLSMTLFHIGLAFDGWAQPSSAPPESVEIGPEKLRTVAGELLQESLILRARAKGLRAKGQLGEADKLDQEAVYKEERAKLLNAKAESLEKRVRSAQELRNVLHQMDVQTVPIPTVDTSGKEGTGIPTVAPRLTLAEKKPSDSFFVRGDYTISPLPSFGYNRNEGIWVGALAPIMKSNAQGELEDIFAPQYLHNRFVGETLTLNYYGYRSNTVQYRVVASYATKVQQNYDLSYLNTGALDGQYILGVQVNWFKNPFARFFGIGNRSAESSESNYTAREGIAKLTAGVNLTEYLSLRVIGRYREVRVDPGLLATEHIDPDTGVVPILPQTSELFPDTPGIEGARILGHQVAVRFDSRDSLLTPTRGTYVNASAESIQNLLHRASTHWWRFNLDARQLVPHMGDQLVFAARVFVDFTSRNDNIPFYELPTLGGESTLRAFGQFRFYDQAAMIASIEERILVHERKIMDNEIDLEIAPFLDVGQVTHNFSQNGFKYLEFNPGIGIRVLARPNVVGRVDFAWGREGSNAFVGIDYPF